MSDYQQLKRSAIRYWERRRIIYNVLLVPPAFVGYCLTDSFNWVGDPHPTNYSFVLLWLSLSAIGANICYSFAYALEFLWGSDNPVSTWQQNGRTVVLFAGILFAMLLALIGGRNIADMEYYHQFRH